MTDKQLARKNKILGLILGTLAIISTLGAMLWLYIYAPLILQ
jgi:hypothetical protein